MFWIGPGHVWPTPKESAPLTAMSGRIAPIMSREGRLAALAGVECPPEQRDACEHQEANPAKAKVGNASGKVEIGGNLV